MSVPPTQKRLQGRSAEAYPVQQQFGVVEADAAQDPQHSPNEADVIHGLGQLDVTKVAWAVGCRGSVCNTALGAVCCAHTQVIDAALFRLAPLIELRSIHLCNGIPPLHKQWSVKHQ